MVMAEELSRTPAAKPATPPAAPPAPAKPAAQQKAQQKPPVKPPSPKSGGIPGLVWVLVGLLVIGAPVGYLVFRMMSGPPGPVAVTPASLDFQATRGGEAPAQKMSVGGKEGVEFDAAPTSDWLDVQPRSGKTPGQIEVRPKPGVLPPGRHFGFVEVTPRGGLKQNFPVSVTIPRR